MSPGSQRVLKKSVNKKTCNLLSMRDIIHSEFDNHVERNFRVNDLDC